MELAFTSGDDSTTFAFKIESFKIERLSDIILICRTQLDDGVCRIVDPIFAHHLRRGIMSEPK